MTVCSHMLPYKLDKFNSLPEIHEMGGGVCGTDALDSVLQSDCSILLHDHIFIK